MIATSDGIEVRFAGVDLAADLPSYVQAPPGGLGVQISLAGVRGEDAMQRDVDDQAALLACTLCRKTEGADNEDPHR